MTTTPETSSSAPHAAAQRRFCPARFFALDGWFRVVSFAGGAPDGYSPLRELGLAALWFLAGCLAMLGGYYVWWPFYPVVPVAGWFFLRHWSRTFYLRLAGGNRWLLLDYGRMFAGAVRVFAALWAVYLLATPWRPAAVEPPPADLLAAAEAAVPDAAVPPDDVFACGFGPAMVGRGTWQILESRPLAFLFGTSPDELRRIGENRKAWWRVCVHASDPEDLCRRAARADRAHLLLGRGGLPHLMDHVLFGSHGPVYDGLVPRGWIFFSDRPDEALVFERSFW